MFRCILDPNVSVIGECNSEGENKVIRAMAFKYLLETYHSEALESKILDPQLERGPQEKLPVRRLA